MYIIIVSTNLIEIDLKRQDNEDYILYTQYKYH